MKTIFALLALSVSTSAFSECYSVYAPSNELVWQSTAPPVPMNTASLSAEVNKKVPKGHLVISTDTGGLCPVVDLTKPRKTMRDKAQEMKYD